MDHYSMLYLPKLLFSFRHKTADVAIKLLFVDAADMIAKVAALAEPFITRITRKSEFLVMNDLNMP